MGEDLEARALAPHLGEIVQIDPGDFGQPGPEYGQKSKMTNIEARVLLGNDLGDKCTIELSMLRITFGINKAFVPLFGQPSLLKATARITTTLTTPMNPVCYDFSSLLPLHAPISDCPFQTPIRTPRFVSHVTFFPLSRFASSSLADVVPLHPYLGL